MIMNIVEIKDKKYNNASDNKNIKFKKYKNYNTIFLFFHIILLTQQLLKIYLCNSFQIIFLN